jgi:hypothetical protein
MGARPELYGDDMIFINPRAVAICSLIAATLLVSGCAGTIDFSRSFRPRMSALICSKPLRRRKLSASGLPLFRSVIPGRKRASARVLQICSIATRRRTGNDEKMHVVFAVIAGLMLCPRGDFNSIHRGDAMKLTLQLHRELA